MAGARALRWLRNEDLHNLVGEEAQLWSREENYFGLEGVSPGKFWSQSSIESCCSETLGSEMWEVFSEGNQCWDK